MSENNSNLNSVVIPFVGTLNDNDMAHPVFYLDENKDMCEALVETPAIQHRKELARNYLRYLPVRFLEESNGRQQKLLLYVIFVTCNWRPIDATNILDLVQNAANKVIWHDDSQFLDVASQRVVAKRLKPEMEHTVVYVEEVSEAYFYKTDYRLRRIQKMNKDYRERYRVQESYLLQILSGDYLRFCNEGFWLDDRFEQIPALAANYQQWVVKHHANGSGE